MKRQEHGIPLDTLIRDNIMIAAESPFQDTAKKFERYLATLPKLESRRAYQEILLLINEFLSKINNISEALFQTAIGLDDDGHLEEAVFLYRLMLTVSPDAKAFNNIAVVLAEQDKEDEAMKFLRQGLAHFPDDETLQENLKSLED